MSNIVWQIFACSLGDVIPEVTIILSMQNLALSRDWFIQETGTFPCCTLIFRTLRVQVPNNYVLTQYLYYNYYYPKPKSTLLLGTWTLCGSIVRIGKLSNVSASCRLSCEEEHWNWLSFLVDKQKLPLLIKTLRHLTWKVLVTCD